MVLCDIRACILGRWPGAGPPHEREHLSAHNRQRSAGPIVHTNPREAGLERLDLGETRHGSEDSCSERHVLD